MTYDVVVIGGGASGMFAAGRAAERGLRVLLLERNERPGKKLSITGNGRCNLTNTDERDEFIENFGRNGKFLYRALTNFSNRDLVVFFHRLGVRTKEEEGGRIFPASDSSESVVHALKRYMKRNEVTVRLDSRAERIMIDPASGAVTGVKVRGSKEIFKTKSVILATGGLSYRATGCTGDGYSMAKELGHTIVPLSPALVPLETEEKSPKDLQGVSLKNVKVTVLSGNRRIASESGDLLFTHYGVSGPVVLALSGLIVERLARKEDEKVAVSINLQPAFERAALEKRLIGELAGSGGKSICTVMKRVLPRSLVPVFLKSIGVGENKICSQITSDERRRLAGLMMDFRLTVRKPRPIDEAIITRGGIDVNEINPRTMESRRVKGLYFCGEIMDIDGNSGGYNLQAAFSTACLAAMSV
jgi:predicted Rossmann fold flavoprotein